jgi:hypothetical protein
MSEKCGNKIKFIVSIDQGTATYDEFECVKEKGHRDDHETYGTTGDKLNWRLIWWSGDWENSSTNKSNPSKGDV